MNGKNIVQFDGNDFLTFERPINSIRSVFLVAKRVSGNRGFLLGHSQNYGFQIRRFNHLKFSLGPRTISMILIFHYSRAYNPNLINDPFRKDGQWKDGLIQDYLSGTSIISITTGWSGSERLTFLKSDWQPILERTFLRIHWCSMRFCLPMPSVRLRDILAHKWIESSLLPSLTPLEREACPFGTGSRNNFSLGQYGWWNQSGYVGKIQSTWADKKGSQKTRIRRNQCESRTRAQ